MSRYLSILNYRTLITLILSLIVPLVAYQFKVVYNIDLTLMSIAIIFPLVFTISISSSFIWRVLCQFVQAGDELNS